MPRNIKRARARAAASGASVGKPGGEGGRREWLLALFGRSEQQVGGKARQEYQRHRDDGHPEGDARRKEVGLRERDRGHEREGERHGVGELLGAVARGQQAPRPEPPWQNPDQEGCGESIEQIRDQTPLRGSLFAAPLSGVASSPPASKTRTDCLSGSLRFAGLLELDSPIAGMYNT